MNKALESVKNQGLAILVKGMSQEVVSIRTASKRENADANPLRL